MSNIEENTGTISTEQTTNEQVEMTLGSAIGKAFFAFLKIFFYFVVLPFKIWKASTYRLAQHNDDAIVGADEEFPMYTFTKVSQDATIFILGIIAVPTAFVGIGFAIYFFMIPSVSFFKEVITMSLVSVQKLTKIENNTSK